MNTNKLLIVLLCVFIACTFSCKKKAKVVPVEPERSTETQGVEQEQVTPQETKPLTEEQLFQQKDLIEISKEFKDAFFDYDKYDIREDQVANLQADADFLKKHGTVRILIEGHCDERGTNEYNMALGAKRANATKDYLVSLGIDSSRIETISFGEEKPFASGHDEDSWWQNRRAHFVATAK
jgi:peptidoglycan-associated lipoprotein